MPKYSPKTAPEILNFKRSLSRELKIRKVIDKHLSVWSAIFYVVPVIATEEEYWQDEDFNPENCKEYVSDVPDEFKVWVSDNAERIEDASQV